MRTFKIFLKHLALTLWRGFLSLNWMTKIVVMAGLFIYLPTYVLWSTKSGYYSEENQAKIQAKKGLEEQKRKTQIAETEIVENSPWDSSVSQVEKYLESTLRDPNSYESIEWSKVIKRNNGNFNVRHKYRARNGFGGMDVANEIFLLDAQGNVLKQTKY